MLSRQRARTDRVPPDVSIGVRRVANGHARSDDSSPDGLSVSLRVGLVGVVALATWRIRSTALRLADVTMRSSVGRAMRALIPQTMTPVRCRNRAPTFRLPALRTRRRRVGFACDIAALGPEDSV